MFFQRHVAPAGQIEGQRAGSRTSRRLTCAMKRLRRVARFEVADAQEVPSQSVVGIALDRLFQPLYSLTVKCGLHVEHGQIAQCRRISGIGRQRLLVVFAGPLAIGPQVIFLGLEVHLLNG